MLNVSDEAKYIREMVRPHYKLLPEKDGLPVTVYQDYCTNVMNRIMLVFMNPSNKAKDVEDWKDESMIMAQGGFIDWLGENIHFYSRFFKTLQEFISGEYQFKEHEFAIDDNGKATDPDRYDEYIQSSFFDDFYVTDYVKLRLTTPQMRRTLSLTDNMQGWDRKELLEEKKKVKAAWDKLLKEEIHCLSPSIIVSFGGNAWTSLRELVLPEAVEGAVTKVHGDHYKILGEYDYIPLAFIPGTSSYLKDSYFDYFKKGLRSMNKIL